jgi:hypothetical protein
MRNPINVNVFATKLSKQKKTQSTKTQAAEREKLRHFLRGTALKIKFILQKERRETTRMNVVYPSSSLISLRHGF